MKRKLRVTIVAAIAAQLIAILAYGGVVVASSHNDIQDHKNGDGVCANCHGGVSEDVSYTIGTRTAKMKSAHGRHTKSRLLSVGSTNCTACHVSTNKTDLMDSGDVARKTVDPALCQRCHGAPVSGNANYTMRYGKTVGHETAASMKKSSCRTGVCHGGSGRAASAALRTLHAEKINGLAAANPLSGAVNTSKTHILCRRCHGGIKLFSATEVN